MQGEWHNMLNPLKLLEQVTFNHRNYLGRNQMFQIKNEKDA
jgi:hypothetical protein